MASSNKITYHARSISLPTESHPLALAVEEKLCQLRSSELATSSSICHNLAGLKDLYECVEDFLQLESIQEGVLDGSLMLLDVCGTTRDVLSQMKQCVQDLQSSLRRRRGGDVDLVNEIAAYMTSKKKITKVIRKCLADVKRMENRNNDLVAEVSVLREVEATTLVVLESLLSFLSRQKPGSKQNSWSLVSKLVPSKRVACNGEKSELEKADMAMNALIGHKQNKIVRDVKNAQKPLEALEMSIQELEDGVESVFRSLIKNRVSLLNVLNQ